MDKLRPKLPLLELRDIKGRWLRLPMESLLELALNAIRHRTVSFMELEAVTLRCSGAALGRTIGARAPRCRSPPPDAAEFCPCEPRFGIVRLVTALVVLSFALSLANCIMRDGSDTVRRSAEGSMPRDWNSCFCASCSSSFDLVRLIKIEEVPFSAF